MALSMYSLVFPDPHRDKRVGLLLKVMGWAASDVPGLRDMWLERAPVVPSGVLVVVYARAASFSHDHGEDIALPQFCKACKRDLLVEDYDGYSVSESDDGSDYVTFRFEPPKRLTSDVKQQLLLRALPKPVDMPYLWARRLDHIRTDEDVV